MELHIRENKFSDDLQELVTMRYEALKKAGFDEDTANMYARICSSVNEAIDAILSRSLSASELSDLRASYGKNFSNFSTQSLSSSSSSAAPNTTTTTTNTTNTTTNAATTQPSMSSIFSTKNFHTTSSSSGGNNSFNAFNNISDGSNINNSSACDSLGLKLISDIDNCLGSILDSDDELPQHNNANLYFNNNNNKFKQQLSSGNIILSDEDINNGSATNKICDNISGSESLLINRSLSPSHFFGIDFLKPKLQTNNTTTSNNSFSIDLNKHTLGSHIVPNHFGRNIDGSGSGGGVSSNFNRNNGISMTSFLNPPKKTFADIASTNTKKAVQPPKTLSQAINARTLTNIQQCFDNNNISNNNNNNNNNFNKEIIISKPLKVGGDSSGNKLSSLESFSAPNSNLIANNGKVSPNVFTANEVTKPTNLMAYKGLWVCNISPEASYVTLKKIFRKYGNFTGLQTFERKATNGSNIVFVHYDNAQSPTDAIAELFGVYRKDICLDEMTPLKLRFTPSMEQTKSGDLPSMEKAKRVVEKSGECFNWRLSSGCHKGERCNFKHIPINKSVDSQPWVKALKKKANEI